MCNRRNFPVALTRESWRKRDVGFTDKGVMMRCVTDDQVSTKGLGFNVDKFLFFI